MKLIQLPTQNVRRRGLLLPPSVGRRGAYALTFRDGRRYLGRTSDVIVRMGGHFRTYDDIVGISFSPVPIDDLDTACLELERQVGGTMRRLIDDSLTASAMTGTGSARESQLDRIRWIETNVAENERQRPPELPGQRVRTRPKFDCLAAHPDFDLLRHLVHRYIECVIPVPGATEVRNWVITSMPSTSRTKVWRRLICLSINNVEALTIGEQFDGERWTVAGFMSASAWPSERRDVLPVAARRNGAFVVPAYYKTVGDVAQIGFDSLTALRPLLNSDRVLDHVGELVMRLMRRGRGMYGRFHDYNLADAVLDARSH